MCYIIMYLLIHNYYLIVFDLSSPCVADGVCRQEEVLSKGIGKGNIQNFYTIPVLG